MYKKFTIKYFHRFTIAVLILFVGTLVMTLPAVALSAPNMNGPVNDNAKVMSSSEKNELSTYLNNLNDQTGVQIAILTVSSLDGESIESYSMKVAEKWQLGQKGKDNGALLLVAIKDRELRIEVGYGLEESLTDAKSGLIIRNVITPYFRDGDYGKGIIAGAKNMAGIATGNAEIVSSAVSSPSKSSSDEEGTALIPFAFIVMFIVMILGGVGRRRRGFYRGGSNRGNGLLSAIIWSSILSNGHRNSNNNHGNSQNPFGGGFGGFGGGGFGGGGGGFGGGGASGKW